jgi:hypothetical protein
LAAWAVRQLVKWHTVLHKAVDIGYIIYIERKPAVKITLEQLNQLNIAEFTEYKKNWWQAYTEANLKVEIKLGKRSKQVIIGYNLNVKELHRFYADLGDSWEINQSKIFATISSLDEIKPLIVEAEQIMLAGDYSLKGNRKTLKTDDQGYFEKTATALKAIIDSEAYDFLTRHTFDQHDKLFDRGRSQAMAANPLAPEWREHLVPCTMILEETVKMVQAGCTVPQLAQMLAENLAIVIITADEAKRLDAVYQTTMPAGWQFGDSVFARLDAMSIAY